MATHFKIAANAAFTDNCTEFYQDPVNGEYNPRYQWPRRGSILPCLSGVQIQDMGLDMQDRKILIRDNYALKQSHVDALQAKYEQKGAEWYFTDGVYTFRVVIWDFQPTLNTRAWFKGLSLAEDGDPPADRYIWYNYEMTLLVRGVIT